MQGIGNQLLVNKTEKKQYGRSESYDTPLKRWKESKPKDYSEDFRKCGGRIISTYFEKRLSVSIAIPVRI